MIVISGDKIAYFDVDDCLIFWDSTPEDKEKNGVAFNCPGSMTCGPDGTIVSKEPWTELLVPNWPQIEYIKKLKLRNHTTVVWSAGGFSWASNVVRTLGLEKYVDVVLAKPSYVFDDLPVSEFMPPSRLITKDSK